MATALAALQPPPGSPASAWSARIGACWQASVKAILEVGRLISAAKDDLAHGEFEKMIDADLPFGSRTAQMLMAIAADPRITNPKHASLLPPSWPTLYELTKLTDEHFEKGIETGAINPEMERKQAVSAARAVAPGRIEPSDSLDFFPTPPWATRALFEKVFPQIGVRYLDSVLEPACGDGHIAEVIREYVRNDMVFASDIHDYRYQHGRFGRAYDYLNPLNHFAGPDWVITNPPFGDATEQFVLRALREAAVGSAMFVRMQWLETKGRYERIFRDQPPTLVAFFAERVPICKGRWDPNSATLTAYVWLVWLKDRLPKAPYWIEPGCRTELAHDDDAARFTTHPVTAVAHPNAGRCPSAAVAAPIDINLDIPEFLKRKPDAVAAA